MGAAESTQSYVVPVEGTGDAEQTPVFRAATHPNEFVESMNAGNKMIETCWDIFQLGLRKKGDGPFLGSRKKNADGTLGPYVWKSYTMVEKLAKYIGSGLLNLECLPILKFPDESVAAAREVRLLGIYSKNRDEWFMLEQAANAYNFALVPLYDTMGAEGLTFIIGQTELPTVVCNEDTIHSLLKVAVGSNISTIVYLDDELSSGVVEDMKRQNIRLVYWKQLLKSGKDATRTVEPGTMDSIHTICYTSGTTGNPKGVLHTQRNFVSAVSAAVRGPMAYKDISLSTNDVNISYLPLAHVMERIISNILISAGAAIGLYRGDTLKLMEDIKELKPTIFVSVPRLYNRVNDKVFGDLAEKPAILQYLFNAGMDAKLANLRKNGTTTHPFWDSLVFNRTRDFMGGRLRYMVVGGAPLPPIIQERMCVLFCCPLLEGFGMTETMGGAFITAPADPVKGTVGGVVASFEFCLKSVPDMDYLVSDNPPRGELCMRGPGVSPGYFRSPEQTRESYDADGWLHSGDISTLLPNGAVKVLDRAKNMFKLAQGEYVAPEKIEQIYCMASLVAQVFCFGYSQKSVLVGVVVPDVEAAMKWAAKNGAEGTAIDALCIMPAFHAAVSAEMAESAKRYGLSGFEKIKAFHVDAEMFSVENGLLTPTFKLRRHTAKMHYQTEIDGLYAQIDGTTASTVAGTPATANSPPGQS